MWGEDAKTPWENAIAGSSGKPPVTAMAAYHAGKTLEQKLRDDDYRRAMYEQKWDSKMALRDHGPRLDSDVLGEVQGTYGPYRVVLKRNRHMDWASDNTIIELTSVKHNIRKIFPVDEVIAMGARAPRGSHEGNRFDEIVNSMAENIDREIHDGMDRRDAEMMSLSPGKIMTTRPREDQKITINIDQGRVKVAKISGGGGGGSLHTRLQAETDSWLKDAKDVIR